MAFRRRIVTAAAPALAALMLALASACGGQSTADAEQAASDPIAIALATMKWRS